MFTVRNKKEFFLLKVVYLPTKRFYKNGAKNVEFCC